MSQLKFELFHAKNPHVYDILVDLARTWKANTGKRIGIAALYERARWQIAFSTTDVDLKLNNDYRAYYSRLIMQNEEDLAGLFNTRASDADGQVAA
jgi:hypothetical protein